ncbi:hypothetical protein HRG84_17880 [Flavisolibacter sp. BT320]|nr:hypothetical protein [Flavisolibacter longurius]
MTTIFAIVLVTGVILSTFLLVLLVNHYRQHKETEEMLRFFNNLSATYHLSIARQEVLGDRIIGLDKENRNLFFLTSEHHGYIIDLDDVKTATLKKEYGLVYDGYSRRTGAKTALTKIELQLIYWAGASPLLLPLYDRENGDSMTREKAIEVGKTWQQLVSGLLARHGVEKTLYKSSSGRKQIKAV